MKVNSPRLILKGNGTMSDMKTVISNMSSAKTCQHRIVSDVVVVTSGGRRTGPYIKLILNENVW